MFNREKSFYGGHGIVGAQVPLGGLAFADRFLGNNDLVYLTYFGEGAANQSQVYETFNMAALWKLPVVFVIENNRYAMGTAVTRSHARAELFARGAAFGIPGEQVDGMDVQAVEEGRRQGGARGHYRPGAVHSRDAHLPLSRPLHIPDPAKYRSRRRSRRCAESTTDRAGQGAPAGEGVRRRAGIEAHRRRDSPARRRCL